VLGCGGYVWWVFYVWELFCLSFLCVSIVFFVGGGGVFSGVLGLGVFLYLLVLGMFGDCW